MNKLLNIIGKGFKISFIILAVLVVCFFALIAICNCDMPDYTIINHYRDDANFINDTATVKYIQYNERAGCIQIGFSNVREAYQNNYFNIPVDVADPKLKINILENIKVGDVVKFTSDPWFYGDGYKTPIVAIWSTDGEPLLEYEEGYANLMKWLKE